MGLMQWYISRLISFCTKIWETDDWSCAGGLVAGLRCLSQWWYWAWSFWYLWMLELDLCLTKEQHHMWLGMPHHLSFCSAASTSFLCQMCQMALQGVFSSLHPIQHERKERKMTLMLPLVWIMVLLPSWSWSKSICNHKTWHHYRIWAPHSPPKFTDSFQRWTPWMDVTSWPAHISPKGKTLGSQVVDVVKVSGSPGYPHYDWVEDHRW